MADDRLDLLTKRISAQANKVLESDLYTKWVEGQNLKEGDLVIFNNSFLYREGLPTNKSDKYLCVSIDSQGQPTSTPLVTVPSSGINASFKRVASNTADGYEKLQLRDAIGSELDRLGTVVLTLVGKVGEDRPASVDVPGNLPIQVLRYDPTQEDSAALDAQTLSLNDIDNIDAAWSASKQALDQAGFDRETVEKVADYFEASFHSLQEYAGRTVSVDEVAGDDESSILGQVVARLDDQIAAYENALQTHKAYSHDPEAYNELLRVAYNFADGTKLLLKLVVGVCDLKPLLFWLTMAEQFTLAATVGNLPFALVGRAKPSLDRYRQLISAARNRAFHDVFAFDRPFVAMLPSNAVERPVLRLFRDYARRREPALDCRREPALDFGDRAVVDLLAEFTRAPGRPVPMGFWDSNLEVMWGVAQVGRAFQQALLDCAPRGATST